MIHSPRNHNSWSWANPKSGTRSSYGSPMQEKAPKALGCPELLFPGHKLGTGWKEGPPGLEPVPVWDSGTCKVRTLTTKLWHLLTLFSSHQAWTPAFSSHRSMGSILGSIHRITKSHMGWIFLHVHHLKPHVPTGSGDLCRHGSVNNPMTNCVLY